MNELEGRVWGSIPQGLDSQVQFSLYLLIWAVGIHDSEPTGQCKTSHDTMIAASTCSRLLRNSFWLLLSPQGRRFSGPKLGREEEQVRRNWGSGGILGHKFWKEAESENVALFQKVLGRREGPWGSLGWPCLVH